MTISQRIVQHAPDISVVSTWTLFGVSLTQINTALQSIALCLSIIVTLIALGIHVRNFFRWLSKINK